MHTLCFGAGKGGLERGEGGEEREEEGRGALSLSSLSLSLSLSFPLSIKGAFLPLFSVADDEEGKKEKEKGGDGGEILSPAVRKKRGLDLAVALLLLLCPPPSCLVGNDQVLPSGYSYNS